MYLFNLHVNNTVSVNATEQKVRNTPSTKYYTFIYIVNCSGSRDPPYQYAWRHYGASLLFPAVLPVRDTSKRTLEGKRDPGNT